MWLLLRGGKRPAPEGGNAPEGGTAESRCRHDMQVKCVGMRGFITIASGLKRCKYAARPDKVVQA